MFRLFKWGGSIAALVTGLGGYMSWKYDTTSVCSAAQTAVDQEMPKVMEELSQEDVRFKALAVGRVLLGGGDSLITGAIKELVREKTEDKTAIECATLVGYRELDRSGFREQLRKEIVAEVDARLGG